MDGVGPRLHRYDAPEEGLGLVRWQRPERPGVDVGGLPAARDAHFLGFNRRARRLAGPAFDHPDRPLVGREFREVGGVVEGVDGRDEVRDRLVAACCGPRSAAARAWRSTAGAGSSRVRPPARTSATVRRRSRASRLRSPRPARGRRAAAPSARAARSGRLAPAARGNPFNLPHTIAPRYQRGSGAGDGSPATAGGSLWRGG